ncbi:hypothetical protein PV726_07965 [Streptomyces europaeiscabiei]|uniref:hypothetical protein n=1 Tax=Streptomyces europaeiscabiei TaxID=146819 RepID=UPI0029A9627F|nr:hypothetical protein [Streptomyces europaeiscabiei]MDX3690260.1 hypothetical protein [Streptomyces europaeiscabiei]
MKALLDSKPVLWFLFLFNLTVAAVAPFVVDGVQGMATAVGMGVVSLGAGIQPPARPGRTAARLSGPPRGDELRRRASRSMCTEDALGAPRSTRRPRDTWEM